jgi:hypothetical protein
VAVATGEEMDRVAVGLGQPMLTAAVGKISGALGGANLLTEKVVALDSQPKAFLTVRLKV